MPDRAYTELFHFTSAALPPETFHVVRFRGTEGLNRLFSFSIDLVSQDSSVDARKVLGDSAVFTIRRQSGGDAVFQGFPTRVEQSGHFNGWTYYQVKLRPAFWKLAQIVQSAIFLDKTIQDVANELLNSQQFFSIPHEFRFTRSDYPAQEFAMQYGESVYDYILWRMEEQGAYFFFAPDGDKIIFADSPQSHDAPSITVSYSPATGLEGEKREEVLTAFTMARTPLPRRVVVRTYDWKDPLKVVLGMADVAAGGMGDVYLTSENVESDTEAERIAKIRAEELICRSRQFSGAGAVPLLRPGLVFTLDRHYNPAFNRGYMVTEITHEGGQEAFLSLGLGIPLRDAAEHLFYRNSFSCIEDDRPYRPARTAPRASIPGVIRAFVDGAGSGARAEMDEYGRYKLLFPFDVSGRKAGNASCWVRMAQPQVGMDHGMSFPLLPGAEVTVAFLNGNPDRPVITGALPNGETGAITGQGNVNFSGIRTPGGNQITFNDTDTHQGISLQTPSGLGLTMTAGSLGATTQHQDLGLDIASVCGNEIANVGKTLVTGCKTVSLATQNWYSLVAALITMLQNGITGPLNSLAADAAKDKDQKKSETYKWSSDGVKTATLAASTVASAINTLTSPGNDYGVSLIGSGGISRSTLQVWPSPWKMIPSIVTWTLARATQFIAEGVDSVMEANEEQKSADKAKKNAQDKLKKDLENAGETLPANPTEQDYKDKYNDAVTKLTEALSQAIKDGDADQVLKLQAQLAELQNDYDALFTEGSESYYGNTESYYKSAKADTQRRAMVSATAEMLPEIVAVVLQSIALGTVGRKEHGGISLYSEDKNINLDALRTISLHSGDGIFLNTDRGTGKGTWGIGAANNDIISGNETINSLSPFVAVKTATHSVEADINREKYGMSQRFADYEKIQHTDGKDYIAVGKDNALIHAQNITLEADSGNKSSVTVNGNGIALFADIDHDTGISINKQAGTLSLHNADACLGLLSDGQIDIESKDG
ncbi:MAG: type VI secretion system tip protein VgrG, partial [Deltaproteobacteria bacterium]|nr:type VI secretion system tip protein VgrG [Deltaproteobacteria bacterium]